MTKRAIIGYLRKNKDLLSLRAIAFNSGFQNLPKVIYGHIDQNGNPFTFPDKYVIPVKRQIYRLQSKALKK